MLAPVRAWVLRIQRVPAFSCKRTIEVVRDGKEPKSRWVLPGPPGAVRRLDAAPFSRTNDFCVDQSVARAQ